MSFWIVLCSLLGVTVISAQLVCNVTVDTYSGGAVPGAVKLNGESVIPLFVPSSAYLAFPVDPQCSLGGVLALPEDAQNGTDLDFKNQHDLVAFLNDVVSATEQINGYLLVSTINCRGDLEALSGMVDTDTDYTALQSLLTELGATYKRDEVPADQIFGSSTHETCDTWVFFIDITDFSKTTNYLVANDSDSQTLEFQFDVIDACDPNPCSDQCVNSNRTYYCECGTGFALHADAHNCTDVNECSDETDSCAQLCINTEGSYTCDCNQGFLLDGDARGCRDVNECLAATHNCSSFCNNTEGGFDCYCSDGYQLQNDSVTCEDINECVQTDPCAQTCNNDAGSYFCTCEEGYLLQSDAHTCEDINECETNNGGCAQTCNNTDGSFSCICPDGFSQAPDGFACFNIDECGTDPCDHTCKDTSGSYECDCRSGFVLAVDNHTCDDINECLTNNGGCLGGCNNTDGLFFCTCEEGLVLLNDGVTCEDINECDTNNGGCFTNCNNTHTSYFCSCDPGYWLLSDAHSCQDINECDDNNAGCSHDCNNNGGSYDCSCPDGFVMEADLHTCLELYCNTTTSCDNGGTCVEGVGQATCDCLPGYTGAACETKLVCHFESCLNGGTCEEVDSADNFTCSCPEIFTGDLCGTQLFCLTDNTCENGGTCTSDSVGITCGCLPGFTGVNCETEIFCETSNICLNGATCGEGDTGVVCECLPNYTGSTCDTELFCEPVDPCQNGATCNDGTGVAICDCPSDYTGTLCETKLYCESDPCENGGSCSETDPGEGYECDCPVGYEDPECSTKLYCELENLCVNGATCREGQDSIICDCLTGFSGPHCEDEDLCVTSNTCVHGTCSMTDTRDAIECDCEPAYSGDICDILLFCEPVDPCENGGTCSEGSGVAVCDCPPGTTGTRCEIVLFCTPDNPCQNGGTCSELPDEGGAECECVPGWQSRYCNLDANECNFGTDDCTYDCINTLGSFICTCFEGYQLAPDSSICEDINECDDSFNGNCSDTCNNNEGSYTCSCPTGYRIQPDQRTCIDIDECIFADSCGHNCTNTDGSYQCTCLDGYKLQADGSTCLDIDECADNNGGCTGTCINKVATYRCTCDSDSSLQGDGRTCVALPSSLSFSSYSPGYGPVDGGTRVTVVGSIPAVYSVTGARLKLSPDVDQATLDSDTADILQCTLNETSDSGVVFVTPPVSTSSSIDLNYTIDITYTDTSTQNNHTVDTGYIFLYKPNPVISAVQPLQFKRSGGTSVTIKGNHFNSVSLPKLCVYIEKRELISDTANYRVIETLKICSADYMKKTSTLLVIVFPAIPSSVLNGLNRRKRETDSTDTNNDLVRTYFGFELDGVETYQDLRMVLGDGQGSIQVYDEPTVETFTDVLKYNADDQDFIEIKGSGFLLGAIADDYTVTLGDGVCTITSVTDTVVTCTPPEEEPEAVQGPYYRREEPHLMLSVGNFETHVGYVNYAGRDKTLMYVLIAIVVCILLVGLVVLLVQIILPRRNRLRNLRRGLIEDGREPRAAHHKPARGEREVGRQRRGGRGQEDTPVADFYSPGWQPPTRKYYSRP